MFFDNIKKNKKLKKLKKYLTLRNECGKVNELLMSNESQKIHLKVLKNLKKFLTNKNECDKINELSQMTANKNLDN